MSKYNPFQDNHILCLVSRHLANYEAKVTNYKPVMQEECEANNTGPEMLEITLDNGSMKKETINLKHLTWSQYLEMAKEADFYIAEKFRMFDERKRKTE
jgi:hypothetical protein